MDLNPHPPLSAFPLVIASLIVLLELANLKLKSKNISTSIQVLIPCLLVISPLTFLSGYWGKEHANKTFQVNPDFIETHKLFAQGLLISLVPLAVFYYLNISRQAKSLYYYLALSLVVCLALYTGYKGGNLVFEHGAAVEANIQKSIYQKD